MHIVTQYRLGSYYAWIENDLKIEGRGYSPKEAIGDLMEKHGDLFGLTFSTLPAGGD